MSLRDRLDEKFDLNRRAVIVQVKCTSTAPFQVQIAGDAASVDAKRIGGQVFAVNDYGLAFWQPPNAPICFKTT
jgi:hypothetical protein